METLRQFEGIPKLLRGSQATHRAAAPNPIDVFGWNARISTGVMTIWHD
jgi:hypothetical protein